MSYGVTCYCQRFTIHTYVGTLVAVPSDIFMKSLNFGALLFEISNIIDILLKSFLFSMHTSFAFNKVWEFLKFD